MFYKGYAKTLAGVRAQGVSWQFGDSSVKEFPGHTGYAVPGVYPTHKGILPVVGNIEAAGIITGTDVTEPLKTAASDVVITDAFRHGNYSSGQVYKVVNILRQDRCSREAVIQLFSARYFDTRCVHTAQFIPNPRGLAMHLSMGKVDAWRELPYILHSWGIIHKIVSACVGMDTGAVRTFTGSMYTRQDDSCDIQAYLNAGAPESPITLSDRLSDLIKYVHDGTIVFGTVQGYSWDELYHAKDSDWSL